MYRGLLNQEDEKCIQSNFVYLKSHLEANDIVDYLYQHSVIALSEREKIKNGLTKDERNDCLLHALLSSGPGESFKHFLQSLQEHYPHVLEYIERKADVNYSLDTALEKMHTLETELARYISRLEDLHRENSDLAERLKACTHEKEQLFAQLQKSRYPKELEDLQRQNSELVERLNASTNEREQLFDQLQKYITSSSTNDTELLSVCGFVQPFGQRDILVTDGNEPELNHAMPEDCEKKAGHVKFVPVKSLKRAQLPESHQIEDLYQHIKVISDLTVRVDVKHTSSGRPELWPNTGACYPLNSTIGNDSLRTGSGMVVDVKKFRNGYSQDGRGERRVNQTCSCNSCTQKPRNVWYEFFVQTAAQLVCDENEARHTSCRLFYDAHDSPLVIISECSIFDVDVARDRCRLHFVSCDTSVGEKLHMRWKEFLQLKERLHRTYRKKKDDNLALMVSHPHGLHKHVSIGQWRDKYDLDRKRYYIKFTHTVCTCPGCTGAYVYCVGYLGCQLQPMHCGRLRSGRGYSTVCDAF